ncbi:MAG: hypothetical protein HOI89_00340 [Phycisphaerae bacterium]|nr:hypothetical protein [Phycisphaerae bacterium]MBT5656221.1 hypothetical protein [Phycisphaerae bacterium]
MHTRRLAALLSPFVLLTTTLPAGTITVDLGGGGDYLDIQSAVNVASDGDTILIMPGTYTQSGKAAAVVWMLNKSITLEGVGDAASVIIDAEDARYGIHFYSSETAMPTIRNLSVTRGQGAGIRAYSSHPSIESCLIFECNGPGVIAAGSASVLMQDCEVSYNVSGHGPAIWNPGATVTAENCEFHHNEATNGTPLDNTLSGSSMSLTNCEIHHNTGTTGGGVYSTFSTLVVVDCEIHHNHGDYVGAAVYAYGTGSAQIAGCDISWNTTPFDGGAVAATSGALLELTSSVIHANEGRGVSVSFGSDATIDNCTLTSNIADDWGGAIYLNGGTHTITNSTIAGNWALNGAAIGTNWQTSVAIDNCVIANNTSTDLWSAALISSYTEGEVLSIGNSGMCNNIPEHMGSHFSSGDLGTNVFETFCTWCPGDADESLTTGLSDVFWIIDRWGPCDGGCQGDFDGDQAIGIGDLLHVLGDWGCTVADPM